MVHSILFVVHHNNIRHNDLFDKDDETYKTLTERHKGAINEYRDKLPKRTPFSCLLQLIVAICGKQKPEAVKKMMSDIIKQEQDQGKLLVGKVICITHSKNCSDYFTYGASIPWERGNPQNATLKDIWITLSCLCTWHPCVSLAVMTYSKENKARFTAPLSNLGADCSAFNDITFSEKVSACGTCCELFSLPSGDKHKYNLPGNCAETEAISEFYKMKGCQLDPAQHAFWSDLKQEKKQQLITMLKKGSDFDFETGFYKPRI